MSRYSIFIAPFLLAACVGSGDETVVILNNQAPSDGCLLAPNESGQGVESGQIDYASGQARLGYEFTPLLKNYSTAADDAEARRHIAFVNGAHVTIHFADKALETQYAGTDLTRFEVPFTGRIDPTGVAQFGYEIVPADLIDMLTPSGSGSGATPAASTLLLVDTSVFGTLNNGSFETQTYRYPVELCDRCLLTVLGACSALSTNFVPTHTGGTCNPFQDGVTDCCTDNSGGAVCPAVGTMAAVR